MKNEFKPKIAVKGFYLPDEVVEDTTLKDADTIDFYSNSSSILMLDRQMTARQIISTVKMLNSVATTLILRLKSIAKEHEEKCRCVNIPEELLQAAGSPKNALLSIEADDGEIYITVASEDEDLTETLPSFLIELFSDCKLDFAALRCLLDSEEPADE